MTEPATAASTWRDWHFGDEPCTYREGCTLPLRTHTHLSPGPGQPVRIVYYDEADAVTPARYCPRCDTDDHRCPGCGAPVEHGAVACLDCNRNA